MRRAASWLDSDLGEFPTLHEAIYGFFLALHCRMTLKYDRSVNQNEPQGSVRGHAMASWRWNFVWWMNPARATRHAECVHTFTADKVRISRSQRSLQKPTRFYKALRHGFRHHAGSDKSHGNASGEHIIRCNFLLWSHSDNSSSSMSSCRKHKTDWD